MVTTFSGSTACWAWRCSRVKAELAITMAPLVITELYQRFSRDLAG
jgi:hypothetical protein